LYHEEFKAPNLKKWKMQYETRTF